MRSFFIGAAAILAAACGLSVVGESASGDTASLDAASGPSLPSSPAPPEEASVDAGADAAFDAGPVFADPPAPQVDIAPLFTDDVILNWRDGGFDPEQDPIDDSHYVLATQTALDQLLGVASATKGMPDDGLFPATIDHPEVQLEYRNTDNGKNSIRVDAGASVTVRLPPRTAGRVQLYGLSAEGDTTLAIAVQYTDGTSANATVKFVDWAKTPGAGTFALRRGLARASVETQTNPTAAATATWSISGTTVQTDNTRTLKQVVVTDDENDKSRFLLLGITADQ